MAAARLIGVPLIGLRTPSNALAAGHVGVRGRRRRRALDLRLRRRGGAVALHLRFFWFATGAAGLHDGRLLTGTPTACHVVSLDTRLLAADPVLGAGAFYGLRGPGLVVRSTRTSLLLRLVRAHLATGRSLPLLLPLPLPLSSWIWTRLRLLLLGVCGGRTV